MIDIFAFLVILAVFLYGIYISKQTNDYLNPIMSFATPIFVGFIFFLVYFREECSDSTVLMYILGVVGYTIGFIFHRCFSYYKLEYLNKSDLEGKARRVEMSSFFMKAFKLITVLSIILTLIYINSVALNGPFGTNIIRNIRYMNNYGNQKGFVTEYSMVVTKVFLCILLYQFFVQGYEHTKHWIWICTIATIIGIASTIARTQILSLAISWYYIYSLKRIINKDDKTKIITWKKVRERWYIVIVVIVISYIFYYLAVQTSKLGLGGFTSSEFFVNRYFGKELVNFENNVRGLGAIGNGYYSLGWISKIFAALGIVHSPGVLEDIILETHGAVCSFMRTPYIDFGVIGVPATMFIMGFANSYIYRRVLARVGYWSIFYTTCIYSNIMAFFDYQYMMSGQMYFLFVMMFAGAMKFKLGTKKIT